MKIALSSLRGKDLTHIATHAGLKSSGTKSVLQSRLAKELQIANIGNGKQRVVSIDLGIRNLAFCSIDISPMWSSVPYQQLKEVTSQKEDHSKDDEYGFSVGDTATKTSRVSILPAIELCSWRHMDISQTGLGADEVYDPPILAPVVYKLVKEELLPLKPDHIIIERQRHRSGGQAAVLEWTFRINMLESMLWSSLETLRAHASDGFNATSDATAEAFQVHAVLPTRVNALLFDEDASGRPKAAEAKIRKTALVEDWLRTGKLRCRLGQATKMRDDFLVAYKAGSQRVSQRQMRAAKLPNDTVEDDKSARSEKETVLQAKKLDDLADCVSQAIAWVQWDKNRRQLLTQLDIDA